MRHGISPIISIVLLVAIAIVSGVGLYFWAGGLATQQPTPETPIAITATPVITSAGELGLMLVNLGDRDLPAGTTFYTSNGAEASLTDALAGGQQALLTFWGGYDGTTTTDFTDPITVYGTSSPAVTLDPAASDPVQEGPCAITSDVNDDIAPSIIQASDDMYYAVWSSNRTGNYELYIANATTICDWSAETQITTRTGTDTNPSLIQADDSAFVVAWQSDLEGDNETYVMSSSDGISWSTPVNVSADTGIDLYPHFLQNSTEGYMLTWGSDRGVDYNVYRANSSDLLSWSNKPDSLFSESISYSITERGGEYFGSIQPNVYNCPAMVCPDSEKSDPGGFNFYNGTADVDANINTDCCAYPSTTIHKSIINEDGYFMFVYDGVEAQNAVSIQISTDANDWFWSQITDTTDSEKHPSLVQDSNDAYILAYATDTNGNFDIYVRSSTDPVLW